jgi:methylmalonyl-CoA mutase
LLEESGLFKYMMNALTGSPGMKIVEQAVEAAVREELNAIEQLGGVLAATEHRYQRSQIQASAYRYERQIQEGARPIIGLNRYAETRNDGPAVKVVRTPRARKQWQIDRLQKFKRRHRAEAERALDRLSETVEGRGNVFAELVKAVEHCSLGQITGRLHELVGRFRPMV